MEKIKIVAVIAEFNPLHRGHKYILKQARAITGATHVLVVLSSNFTQRAEPAIMEKHARAKAAISAGADAVIEIPTAYATGNAEIFAKAGIKLAVSFPHVTNIVFGTESRDISLLKLIATTQVKKKSDFEKYMHGHLKQGISFDKARCEVIKKLLPNISADLIEKTMNTPNNILGIEYLKELARLKSTVVPIGVQRINCPSASQIRETRMLQGLYASSTIKKKDNLYLSKKNFESFGQIALFSLMTRLCTEIYNSNEELVNLIKNLHPISYDDLKRDAPTKRFSVSRIARLALHSALDIKKPDIEFLYKNEWLPYTNLLAINTDAGNLFSALCLNSKTPVVVRGNKIKPKENAYYKTLKAIDARAELLYEAITGKHHEKNTLFVKK
ncbi:MAG: nucleotidyltransferase family protein [Firmicutes bacterium]|nr:nucleotidyltransferase family protein [Bacillota bacterium]